jgi:hypothetical protein
MASPGFSVNDLLEAASKCRDIYHAFRGEYDNAPSRIQELVDTCKYLDDVLQAIRGIFGDNYYPQESSFASRLNECEAFINRYKLLKNDFTRSNGASNGAGKEQWLKLWDATQRAYQTSRYAFEVEEAQRLKDALSLEIQKLNLFILIFALFVFPSR